LVDVSIIAFNCRTSVPSTAVELEDKPQLSRPQSKIVSHCRPTLAEEANLGARVATRREICWVDLMANRILQLMLVMLAGVVLAAAPVSAAPAADECLAKPTGPPPSGKHWYYQTNRTTRRKCWYLADAGAKVVKPSRPKEAASAPPDDAGNPTEQPIANAHAELTDQSRAEQPVVSATQPSPEISHTEPFPEASHTEPLPEALHSQPSPETSQGAADGTNTRTWALASRWPDSSIAYASNREMAANNPEPASRTAETASPPPVLAANTLVPVEQPPAAVDSSDYVPFVQFAAALIVIVVLGGVILIPLASRLRDRRNFPSQRPVTPHALFRGDLHRAEMPWARAGARTVEPEDMERLLIARQVRPARPS
jgi:hypothetical protein